VLGDEERVEDRAISILDDASLFGRMRKRGDYYH